MDIIQIGIFFFGATSIWFVSRKEEWKKWGYVLGLIGQPFWLYSAIEHKQYGIIILVAVYIYSNCQGIYNYFNFKKPKL